MPSKGLDYPYSHLLQDSRLYVCHPQEMKMKPTVPCHLPNTKTQREMSTMPLSYTKRQAGSREGR